MKRQAQYVSRPPFCGPLKPHQDEIVVLCVIWHNVKQTTTTTIPTKTTNTARQRDNETTTAADTSIYDHEFVLLTLLKFFSDKLLFLFRVLTFERFMVFLCVRVCVYVCVCCALCCFCYYNCGCCCRCCCCLF